MFCKQTDNLSLHLFLKDARMEKKIIQKSRSLTPGYITHRSTVSM